MALLALGLLGKKAYPGTVLSGFTVTKVLFPVSAAMAILASLAFITASGLGIGRETREEARATEILLEKVEMLRRCSWAELTAAGSISKTFQAHYDPKPGSRQDFVYSGSIEISGGGLSESYSNDLRKVTVSLMWNSGSEARQRQVTTLISKFGMQSNNRAH